MATYTLSPIFAPQYVPSSAGALTFAPAGGTTVPANYRYQIQVCRVANNSASPVSLEIWRVPSGSANDAQHIRVPSTVLIPVATQTFPWFDVGVLWGVNLGPGDSIWAVAGTGSTLVIDADGAVIVP